MTCSIPPAVSVRAFVVLAAILSFAPPAGAQSVSVTNYHNDTLRTGWNPNETSLTVANVGGGQFGLQHSVALDEQVDAQPLVVANQAIAGQGVHTVVYVVTENDTVYAVDAFTGAVLLSRNLGTPVPQGRLSSCPDNGPNVGIASTPAISVANQALYLVADTYENNTPVYRVHALDLGTLQDKVAPVVVAASHQLAGGSSFTFVAANSRQRSALLLLGSTVYAAFAGFCDKNSNSRGWMLGWSVPSLAPLPFNELTDQLASAPDNMFLSSIWMSGYGAAAAGPTGPIYFVTGNSDRSGTTYNVPNNLAESVVRVSTNLSQPRVLFTPTNESTLDQEDRDFGAGGAMLLPGQSGLTPKLLLAAGKDGQLYLLNRGAPGAAPLSNPRIGPCFCGPSYFVGSDKAARVVTSGGQTMTTWLVNNSPSSGTTLKQDRNVNITSGQDGGFFTSVSSQQSKAGSAIIWAVGHPTNSNPANVMLYAIDPVAGSIIYSAVAGTWPNVGANANIVPTIANGQVYVASNRELAIFGLGNPQGAADTARMLAARAETHRLVAASLVLGPGEHLIFGTVQTARGSSLTIRKRNGALVVADISGIALPDELAHPVRGTAIRVIGVYADDGVLAARSVHRAKRDPALWLADR